MAFGDYIKSGLEIIKLNQAETEKIGKDEKAFGMGLLFIVIAGVAAAIGTFNLPGIIINPIMFVVGSFIGVAIFHVLALIFGGQASYMELFRPMAIMYILNWIAVIPIIGPFLAMLAGLWGIVVLVVILKAVHKLSTARAIIVVLIPVLVVVVLMVIALVFLVGTIATLGGAGIASQLGALG